jgi:ATP-dependent 26S proteasome regulatory subunit
MFCSEMDGIDSLNDVVIILASNRADLIDPAILRPGRIDRKIKVNRPDKEGTREIYRIYLPTICHTTACSRRRLMESARLSNAWSSGLLTGNLPAVMKINFWK